MKDEKNYDLKSEAVEKLTDDSETPSYSKEELEKYRSKSKFGLSDTVKVLLLKLWFAGAVCYFFVWGLSMYLNVVDLVFVLGIAQGMVTDLLTNNVIRFFEKTRGENDRWLMVPQKGVVGLFGNILYGLAVVFCVVMTYNLINAAAAAITGSPEAVFLGVEPILYGVFSMGYDVLFVTAKNLVKRRLGK